jgi:hypothetical protein
VPVLVVELAAEADAWVGGPATPLSTAVVKAYV